MIKKVVYILLAALLAVSVGCGKSGEIEKLEKAAMEGDADAGQQLMDFLANDEDSDTRAGAARALGNAKVKEANNYLQQSLDMDDDSVREEVVLSLGKIGIPENIGIVLGVWNNSNEKRAVKLQALESLGYFSDNKALDILIKSVDSTDSDIKDIAIKALGNSPSPKVIAPLLKILKEDNYNTLAAESLAKLKSKSSYKQITIILDNKINNYEFDDVFSILVKLLSDEKYVEAKDVFAKGYLFIAESKTDLKKQLLEGMKNISLDKSYAVVTASVLNLRSKPNDRSDVTGSLDAGELATIIEVGKLKYKIREMHNFWYKVKTEKNKVGWVYGGFLKILDHTKLDEME